VENSSGTKSESKTPVDRGDDATSKETVKDLEETTTEIPSAGFEQGSGPSPDGSLDESDETKDAGPM
jgi:hypothetical protein